MPEARTTVSMVTLMRYVTMATQYVKYVLVTSSTDKSQNLSFIMENKGMSARNLLPIGKPCDSKFSSLRLSDPKNRAKLFQEILNDLIAKQQKLQEQSEQPLSEYRRSFSNTNQNRDNIEEVSVIIIKPMDFIILTGNKL